MVPGMVPTMYENECGRHALRFLRTAKQRPRIHKRAGPRIRVEKDLSISLNRRLVSILILAAGVGIWENVRSLPPKASGILQQFREAPRTLRELKPLPLIFAIYFPQFHVFNENSRLWGENFTEWDHLRRVRDTGIPSLTIKWPGELGMYDLLDPSLRRRQETLARKHGVDAFIYYHYWLNGGPVMEKGLLKILEDGAPNLKFALCWANEPWTKRWDGGNRDVLLDQVYETGGVQRHYDFLKKFFADPRYLKGPNQQGRLLFMYRGNDFVNPADAYTVAQMIDEWQALAEEDGFGPLHVVQFLGSPTQVQASAWAAGTVEFWPGFTYLNKLDNTRTAKQKADHPKPTYGAQCHYPGTYAGWNSIPRQLASGRASWNLVDSTAHSIEVAVESALVKMISYRKPNCLDFVLINAWNEWGEGNVLEPDNISGSSSLSAVVRARNRVSRKLNERIRVHSQMPKICIVARLHKARLDVLTWHLREFEASLRAIPNLRYEVLVVDVRGSEADEMFLNHIVELQHFAFLRARQSLFEQWVGPTQSIVMDWSIRNCANDAEWVTVTDLSVPYEPHSLSWVNSPLTLNMNYDAVQVPHRNSRDAETYLNSIRGLPTTLFYKTLCSSSRQRSNLHTPDLRAVFFRYSRFVSDDLSFASFRLDSGDRTEEAVIQHIKRRWNILKYESKRTKDDTVTDVASCSKYGGIWLASPVFDEQRCYSKDAFWGRVVGTDGRRLDGPMKGHFTHSVTDGCVTFNDITPEQFINISDLSKTPRQTPSQEVLSATAQGLLNISGKCRMQFDVDFYQKTSCDSCSSKEARVHFVNEGYAKNLPFRFFPSPESNSLEISEILAASVHGGEVSGNEITQCFLFGTLMQKYKQKFEPSCGGQPAVVSGKKLMRVCPLLSSAFSADKRAHFIRDVCAIEVTPAYVRLNPDVGRSRMHPSDHFFMHGYKEDRSASFVVQSFFRHCGNLVISETCGHLHSLATGGDWTALYYLCTEMESTHYPRACGRALNKKNAHKVLEASLAVDSLKVGKFIETVTRDLFIILDTPLECAA
jgi:hypothetical protein